jgi:NADH:ubiquinone oxidoreductase subunit 3 (subunit A)
MNYLKKKLENNKYLFFNRSLVLEPIFSTLEKQEYFKIFNFFIIICLISILLFSIAYFLSLNTVKDSEKLSQYECGFEPFDEATRHPFDVHFYIVGILFLIFDVEIALLFPWVMGLKFSSWWGFFTMLIFLIVLTAGFFYEWHRGALMWPHKKLEKK